MAITGWPHQERPREKPLARGPGALSDAELLAIFLRTGVRGKTAVDLGRDLLQQFGSLRGLLESGSDALSATLGLGPAKCTQLQAILEMARRYLGAQIERGDVLSHADATRDYLCAHLRAYRQEVFGCLFLDQRHRVIAFDELFHGTIDSASVHPREVVKQALARNAAAVILAHNHPSGVAEPSQADHHITQRLKAALALVDIRLLDHFIIGDGRAVSLAERGLV